MQVPCSIRAEGLHVGASAEGGRGKGFPARARGGRVPGNGLSIGALKPPQEVKGESGDGRDGGFGDFPAADELERFEQGIQGGVDLVENLEEGHADDAVGHDVAGERLERVVKQFSDRFVFGDKRLKDGVVREVLDEAGDVEIGRHAADVLLEAGDGLLAEDAGVVAHLDEGFPLVGREAHGAVAERGADGLQGAVENGDFGGGEFNAC